MAADYSNNDLKKIRKWSDSTDHTKKEQKHVERIYLKGKYVTSEKTRIEFVLAISISPTVPDVKSYGEIYVKSDLNRKGILDQLTGYAAKYNLDFDSVAIENDSANGIQKLFFQFDNYSPKTTSVFKRFDSSMIRLLKHEYFDFYFNDLNKKTSKWQVEYRDFRQPFSDVLILLIRKNNIQGIFDLIALKNQGFSWALAEGLWYYNSVKPCLTSEQVKIVDDYNGQNGWISFRPKDQLEKLYKF